MIGNTFSRLKRAATLVGVGALVVGGTVLGSTAAHAAIGNGPGQLSLTPATGATTGQAITYATTTACPAGNNGSGVVRIVDPGTGQTDNLSVVNNSVTAPFSGSLNTDAFSGEEAVFPDLAGSTFEVVVACFPGASAVGPAVYVQDTFVTLDSTGSTYTETNSGPATNTTTTLTANPNPATDGQSVVLTATVAPATAAGTVQFSVGGTAIGSPVTVANGVATTSYVPNGFTSAGTVNVTAAFTGGTGFNGSQGTLSLPVNPAPANSGQIPLGVSIPATGSFKLTVDTADTVNLAVDSGVTSATAPTTAIVVTDTRNTFPGWSVSGQGNPWTGSGTAAGSTIPADQLGWAPTGVTPLAQGVTLGSPVTAGTNPGLGDGAQVLASVHAGTGNGIGTTTLGANLTLAIPTAQAAGAYSSGLNITGVSTNP
ncbi:MAG TPA: Ig-like domain repeat protein [Trebonia sp.]